MNKTWRRASKTSTGGFIGRLPRAIITENLYTQTRWTATSIGIAAVEDKVVQQAVVTVLNAIYEGTSSVFRMGSGRGGAHDALDALTRGSCEEGELDFGCGCPRLFRPSRPWASAGVYPETCGRSKGTAADPEMAESRSIGGWEVVGDEGGDSARGGDLAAFSEHLSALRTGPMVVWWRKRYAIGTWLWSATRMTSSSGSSTGK